MYERNACRKIFPSVSGGVNEQGWACYVPRNVVISAGHLVLFGQ
jgi:hypothetical protein